MAKLTPNQLKAVGWYAEMHNLKLALSAPPRIFYTTNEGKEVEKNILTLVSLWKRDRKEKKT